MPAPSGGHRAAFGAIGAHALGVALIFVVITVLHVVVGEQAPKIVALRYPEQFALATVGAVRFFRAVLRPVIWLLNELTWLTAATVGASRNVEQHSSFGADELRLVVTASAEAGELDEQQEFMLQRVLRFADLTVESVMIPRPEVIAIPAETSTQDAIAFAKEQRHSRYPVYRDDLDTVIGVLHARDLLLAEPGTTLESLPREPLVVPAQMSVQELLRQMRVRRRQFAIVVDEYGGTDGIVTLENVLEEIVGELQDEFEVPEEAAVRERGGAVRIDAAESVDILEELLGLEVAPGRYKTVAGLALERLGDIPKVGDEVEIDGYRFRVAEMDDLRIALVEARRMSSPTPRESVP